MLNKTGRVGRPGFCARVVSLFRKVGFPVVRRLARLGDKSSETSAWRTVRGNAQTPLAKEGDRGEFSSIVLELDDLSYEDGITKLKFIGGREAFEALLAALSLRTFMRSERWKYYDRSYVKVDEERVQRAVMAALPDRYGIRLFLLRTYQARRT